MGVRPPLFPAAAAGRSANGVDRICFTYSNVGRFRLTGEHSYGSTTTLGSQNARGPVALVGPCRERERHVRPPALDLPALQGVSAHTRLMN